MILQEINNLIEESRRQDKMLKKGLLSTSGVEKLNSHISQYSKGVRRRRFEGGWGKSIPPSEVVGSEYYHNTASHEKIAAQDAKEYIKNNMTNQDAKQKDIELIQRIHRNLGQSIDNGLSKREIDFVNKKEKIRQDAKQFNDDLKNTQTQAEINNYHELKNLKNKAQDKSSKLVTALKVAGGLAVGGVGLYGIKTAYDTSRNK